uniref:FtsK/SpoIIIE family DNA translocase n=1 Tax=Pararhizobium sp. IMCC3301 TaxID=3067904 RepID=UPI00274197CD|nr:DNA translocase FtsK 4TM domain-containing protein [Pararhizobium sp. IMCC3301]
MRNAASFQIHTAGPLNYVDYDADRQIADQLAYANQIPSISERHGIRYWLGRNLSAASGLLLIAIAAAGAASLATWSVQDPSLNFAASGQPRNALGAPGAITADLFMQFFGLGSIILLLILAVWGWRLVFGQRLLRHKRRIGFSVAAMVFAAGTVSALPVTANWPLPMGLGGVVGDVMIWLPVAAFGNLFSGFISYLTAVIFGLICVFSFVMAVWRRSGAAQPVHSEPDYAPSRDDYEDDYDDEPSSGFGISAVAAYGVGAMVHLALSSRAMTGRALRKLAGSGKTARAEGRRNRVTARSEPSMSAVERRQDSSARSWQEDDRDSDAPEAGDWVDGEFVAYDQQPADVWSDEVSQQSARPGTVARAAAADVRTAETEGQAKRPGAAQRAHAAPQNRVTAPKPTPKPGKRASREAQPDLLGSQDYELPSLHFLSEPVHTNASANLNTDALEQNARLLEGVLEDFGVRGEIINVRPGPVVTLYELEPAPGIKSSRVIGLADDIARSMSAIAARVAVIPGRNAIGIELPNAKRETVFLRELLDSSDFEKTKAKLALCLGKTIGGEAVIADLAKMPHLLVAGTTGSGKSVAINTMILSLLYRMTPDQCRLIMIDPKMLELSVYDGIPHLLTPVVTDPKKAVVALKWTVREMEDRYKKMSKLGVRNIDGFNSRVAQASKKREVMTRTVQTGFDHETGEAIYEQEELNLEKMPYIVVIIDEMADLMMVAGKEIEGTVQRLAQMARAAGIHVVMATQRPSVDVITGTIKANFPTRISFQVTSKIDSRTILGEQGAEQLLGMGDMLFMAGGGRIQRVHGPFVDDQEVEEIVAHLQTQGVPEYLEAITNEDEVETSAVLDAMTGGGDGGEADLYDQAVAVVLRDKKVSTSYVQRRLSIGYNRAASIIERMEQEGVISAPNHAGKRDILVGNAEETI